MRKRLLILTFSLVIVGLSGAVTAIANPTMVPRVAAVLSGQAVTDFNVIVGPGSLNRMQTFSSTGIFNSGGSVLANSLVTVTVTRPDASVLNFRQRTDTDGRMRGFIYPAVINQTGTYQLQVAADGGGTASAPFTALDPADAGNLTTGTLNTDRLASTFLASIGGNNSSTNYRGKSIINTEESTDSATYTTMPTPDEVTVTLPEDGLLTVDYRALFKYDTFGLGGYSACASIFLNDNQITVPSGNQAPVSPDSCDLPSYAGPDQLYFAPFYFGPEAGVAFDFSNSADSSDVTTGETIANNPAVSGTVRVFAAAGTYSVSVRYSTDQANAPGSQISVKNRKLWVKAEGY